MLALCILVALAAAGTRPTVGAVRAVIGAGSSDRVVDVAVIDAEGNEYVGDERGAGASETLPEIRSGRVRVNVGACSTPAQVRPGRTVVVRFTAADCLR